jgi:uncharacterized protein
MQPTDRAVIASTRRWVKEIVVGLNLCPFAHEPFDKDGISYRMTRATDREAVYADLLRALEEFLHADQQQEATGLFICPDALGDFEEYNDFLALIDDALARANLEGWVQIASFHPDYRFADVDPDDPANYTNRSPYPMFHFIREEALTRALESYPQPEAIPERNVALLRQLGATDMERRLAAIRDGNP